MILDKDGKQDPQGGPFYNGYDRVRLEFQYRQAVKKEKEALQKAAEDNIRSYGSANNFQMNFANQNRWDGGSPALKYSHNRIEQVTEKEIKKSPQERSSMKGLADDSVEVMAIKHMRKRPTEKWDVPICGSHEIGWLLANPVRSDALEPPNGKATRRHKERMRRQGLSASQIMFSPKSSSMPTSDRVMPKILSAPHISGDPPHRALDNLNSRRLYKPKGSCDVTRYAAAYYYAMKHDAFNKALAGR
jgi:hypothetical protein